MFKTLARLFKIATPQRAEVAALVCLVGCTPGEPISSDPLFAIYASHSEELKENFDLILSEPRGPVPVCVSWIGFEGPNERATRSGLPSFLTKLQASERKFMLETWVNTSLGSWFEHEGFPKLQSPQDAPSQRTVFTHLEDDLCPGSLWRSGNEGPHTRDIKVLVFGDPEAQAKTFCDTRLAGTRRAGVIACSQRHEYLTSQGDFRSTTLIVSPLVQGGSIRPQEKYAPTVLHEMGHIFGLFDQYTRSDVPGAPKIAAPLSIMSYRSNHITRDDIAGILAAHHFAQSGIATCDPKASNGAIPIASASRILFCHFIKLGLAPGKNDHD